MFDINNKDKVLKHENDEARSRHALVLTHTHGPTQISLIEMIKILFLSLVLGIISVQAVTKEELDATLGSLRDIDDQFIPSKLQFDVKKVLLLTQLYPLTQQVLLDSLNVIFWNMILLLQKISTAKELSTRLGFEFTIADDVEKFFNVFRSIPRYFFNNRLKSDIGGNTISNLKEKCQNAISEELSHNAMIAMIQSTASRISKLALKDDLFKTDFVDAINLFEFNFPWGLFFETLKQQMIEHHDNPYVIPAAIEIINSFDPSGETSSYFEQLFPNTEFAEKNLLFLARFLPEPEEHRRSKDSIKKNLILQLSHFKTDFYATHYRELVIKVKTYVKNCIYKNMWNFFKLASTAEAKDEDNLSNLLEMGSLKLIGFYNSIGHLIERFNIRKLIRDNKEDSHRIEQLKDIFIGAVIAVTKSITSRISKISNKKDLFLSDDIVPEMSFSYDFSMIEFADKLLSIKQESEDYRDNLIQVAIKAIDAFDASGKATEFFCEDFYRNEWSKDREAWIGAVVRSSSRRA